MELLRLGPRWHFCFWVDFLFYFFLVVSHLRDIFRGTYCFLIGGGDLNGRKAFLLS